MSQFEWLLFVLSIGAGAVASICGFGIGSLLTPFLALQFETRLAVALVAFPHFVATALRFFMLRKFIDWQVLRTFGVASGCGGLVGAVLAMFFENRWLSITLGLLLILSGITTFFGIAQRVQLSSGQSIVVGFVSGTFGGLVGNQGGIRASGLVGMEIAREAFVATSTAVGVAVDLARLPIYGLMEFVQLIEKAWMIGLASLGVTIGTYIGIWLLRNLSENLFKKVIAVAVFSLGIYLVVKSS